MNDSEKRYTVGVYCKQEANGLLKALDALSKVLGFDLLYLHHASLPPVDGVIGVDLPLDMSNAVNRVGLPTFLASRQAIGGILAQVRFSKESAVPAAFRGAEFPSIEAVAFETPPPGTVLARSEDGPIWVTSRSDTNLRKDYLSVPASWLRDEDCLFEHLDGARLMSLLPLLDWLRSVLHKDQWKLPPMRACFMFDDPNLHAESYGFLSFPRLIEEGRHYSYHTSIATVPLDAFYVNSRVADLCRRGTDVLSFLVHGNNHIKRELGLAYSEGERSAIVKQSLARIALLEQRTGLQICRIMAAPHGACSESMLDEMSRNGYEAATISSGSLRAYNSNQPWVHQLGVTPVEIIAGLPVMGRFRLRRGCESNIRWAAYLGQPIIPVGHHWDLAEDRNLLKDTASLINSLGPVSWIPMRLIARSNYLLRTKSDCMEIRLLSRHANIPLINGAAIMNIYAPWLNSSKEKLLIEVQRGREVVASKVDATSSLSVNVVGAESVSARVLSDDQSVPRERSKRTPLSAISRRMLTEARDRAMVHLPFKFLRKR